MKFDFCIGNPPYQETIEGTSDKPVYNDFLDAAYSVSDKVELIHPARFLFNAGKTPKAWNEKMLSDTHLKVMYYERDSSLVFSNTSIRGGIAITYRDNRKHYGEIGVFSEFPELNSILAKLNALNYQSFSDLVYAPESYKFTAAVHRDFPDIKGLLSSGHSFDLTSNIFDKLVDIVFFQDCPSDSCSYTKVWGRKNNERACMWINRDYIRGPSNFNAYKVFLSKAAGAGSYGETLSAPLVVPPMNGHTQTFLSIGSFQSVVEAANLSKYIKTKFCRALLGVLKVTQDNKKSVWKYVPVQDFSSCSDVDWTASIAEIDQQLYKKYGFSKEEIDFIETHVKEME